jgi:hypothetical protein
VLEVRQFADLARLRIAAEGAVRQFLGNDRRLVHVIALLCTKRQRAQCGSCSPKIGAAFSPTCPEIDAIQAKAAVTANAATKAKDIRLML